MRSNLLLFALWASTTSAFHIYFPEWVEAREKNGRRTVGKPSIRGTTLDMKQRAGQHANTPARQAARLQAKYAGRNSAAPADASILKRDNEYDVLEAEDTGEDSAVGIDQDGTDYSYFVQVQLGSEEKDLYMLIDTGAGSTWVMGSDCTTEACTLHDSFGAEDSDTFKADTKSFSINYGSGSVKGTLATDRFHIGGLSFDFQFGVASETSSDFVHFPFDGILGLSMNTGVSESFLGALSDDNDVESNLFAVSLHRAEDGPNTGQIRFGSTDPDQYEGDISYSPISTNEDWAIAIDDMSYDGKKAGVGGMTCFIDTGTTFIFGPPDAVKKIHSVIPGASSGDDTTWTVPCDSTGTLAFTFSGVDYEVSAKDWISPPSSAGVCTSNLYGQEFVEDSWVLGDAFLKNVYAVFDADQNQIGFAPQVQVSVPTTSAAPPLTTMSTASMPSSPTVIETTFTSENTTVVSTMTMESDLDDRPTGTMAEENASETTAPSEGGDSAAPRPSLNAKGATVLGLVTLLLLV